MSEQKFYLTENSEDIVIKEQQYDSFITNEPRKKNNNPTFFLKKMKEIIFCHKNSLPTKQKEKDLRAYRDAEVADK